MSPTTQMNQAQASAALERARQAAAQASVLAKNASTTAAQGVQDARDWAAPRVAQGIYQARAWSAPRIDQAGHKVEETVAPKVHGALSSTAQWVNPSEQAAAKRRVWPRLVTALAVATVIGGVVAAIVRGRSARVNDVPLDEDMTEQAPEPDAAAGDEPTMTDAGVAGNGKRAAT